MSIYDDLRNDASILNIDGSGLETNDQNLYVKYFDYIVDGIYKELKISPDDFSHNNLYKNFNVVQDYYDVFSQKGIVDEFVKINRKTGAGKRWLKGSFKNFMEHKYKGSNIYTIIVKVLAKKYKPTIDNILAVGADIDREKRVDRLVVKQEKEKTKLQEKLNLSRNEVILIEDEINQIKKDRPPGYKALVDELEKKKSDKLLLVSDLNSSIDKIDRTLIKEMQEREKAQRSTAAENRRKHKKMSQESNKLAKEIQKTIERVAAEGFGGGEYQYTGRGMKKAPIKVKKSPKKAPKPAKKAKGGKRYYEDPREEVAYILKRLGDLMEEGDLEHIDVIAKKLRKVKKIGRGKYYVMDKFEEIDGGKMKKAKKEKRAPRPLSPKQKEWMDLVNKVQAKNPNLSRKQCMQLASEKRNKMKNV